MSEHLKEHLEQGDLLEVGAHEEHGGNGKYIAVFFALCILTTASFFTYSSYWPFNKEVARAFMLAVSCTKAMLVIMFFMHLYWEANWKWVLTIPASFMSIFLMLMLVPDVGMRIYNGYEGYSRERWTYAANKQNVQASDQKALEAEEKPGPHSLAPGLPAPAQ
ncbi:MAG TPA: cytochrome C oxidase subunit IV family protein [Lacipirellulaceae bacterium]|jgi:cytochrome c oxidase subunit 4